MDNPTEGQAALQEFWALCCAISLRRGVDVPPRLAKWSEQKKQSLDEYSTKPSFEKLCANGCYQLPPAIVMAIVQPLRSFEKKWKRITGTPRERDQTIRAIEKAAIALEGLLGSLEEAFSEDDSLELVSDENLRRQRTASPVFVLPYSDTLDLVDIHTTIGSLKACASILQVFELSKASGVASADMFVKYLFSAYVYRATTQFHDEEVSVLIGSVMGTSYDETAHRMWRSRNYRRIDLRLSGVADILTDFGKVSAM
jgi:hypothetical protein